MHRPFSSQGVQATWASQARADSIALHLTQLAFHRAEHDGREHTAVWTHRGAAALGSDVAMASLPLMISQASRTIRDTSSAHVETLRMSPCVIPAQLLAKASSVSATLGRPPAGHPSAVGTLPR